MDDDRRFRSFFLGAGFSAPAGLPLGPQLWHAVLAGVDQEYGKDNRVRSDLARFIEFKRATTGEELTAESVDFEEFAGYLDIEHSLGLRGSDTWSDSGNESQLIIRWFIGKILYERQKAGFGATTVGIPSIR